MTFPNEAPYFASPSPSDAAARRRGVLVTLTFPPDPSIGSLRWRKMAHDFVARGWLLDVVTLPPALMAGRDLHSLADLPPGVRAYGVAPPSTARQMAQAALLRGVRVVRGIRATARSRGDAAPSAPATPPRAAAESGDGGATISTEALMREGITPRALRAWLLDSAERSSFDAWGRAVSEQVRGLVAADGRGYDVVMSSGPPHAAHDVARRIASRLGAPLVIDLRDPWALRLRFHVATATRQKVQTDARQERAAVEAARLVVLNTEAATEAMRARYPAQAARMITVRNGTDHDPVPSLSKQARFTLAYAGAIYLDRSPLVLFRALRRAVDTLGLSPSDIALEMVGSVQLSDGVPTMQLAEREGVAAFVHLGQSLPRDAAREFLARAHLLVSLPWDGMLQVPAKIYEIVDYAAWVLVFTPPGSAPEQLLAGTDADVVGNTDDETAAAVIVRRYREFLAGVTPTPVNVDGRFDRAHQARVLLDALDRVVPPR